MSLQALDVAKYLREGHNFLVIGGNVDDTIPLGKRSYERFYEFLVDMTRNRWPNLVTYDAFNGLVVGRGEDDFRKFFEPVTGDEDADDAAGRLDDPLAKAAAEAAVEFKQRTSEQPDDDRLVSPVMALKKIHRLLTGGDIKLKPVTVIVNYAEEVIEKGSSHGQLDVAALKVAIKELCQDSRVRSGKHLIVLIGRYAHELATLLPRPTNARILRIGKPGREAREKHAQGLGFSPPLSGVFARAAKGLSFKDMSQIAESVANDKLAEQSLLDVCFKVKKEIVEEECGDLLEIIRPKLGFEVIGGLEKVVSEFKRVAEDMRKGNLAAVPQGILLLGPPGTGKTLLVEALAKDAGLNAFALKDVKSKWVGDSERNMTRAQDFLRDYGGILFIDEFDQQQGKRGGQDGDSGVSRNLFGKMLTFMGDVSLRGHVLGVLASNRPDLIDPAMLRPGRCDLILALPKPDEARLTAIFERSLLQFEGAESRVKNWRKFAKKCSGYSGADVVEISRRALVHAVREGHSVVRDADVAWACSDYRPRMTNQVQEAEMELAAFQACTSWSLMPENAEMRISECTRIIEQSKLAR